MDKAESIVASKRVAEWPEEDREWLALLPPLEREIALLLVAHLDARPHDNEKETK